jgi:putative tricarboxylic transport membrane protein
MIKRYLFAILALVFVIVYWSSAAKLPERAIIFPRFITFLLIPIFIWVFIQSYNEFRKLEKDTATPENKKYDMRMGLTKTKLVITGITVAYVLIMPVVGYVVTTAAYIAGLSFYLGNRKPLSLILFTVIFFAIVYGVFVVWLRINVPQGFLI